MAASFNLLRNSRVFFTTDVNATTGKITEGSITTTNTQELTVLDNFSMSQSAANENITIAEAGATPSRGQRSFNTALNPVDFSFSTYIRPYSASSLVKSEDAVLWNALLGDTSINDAGTQLGLTFTAVTHSALGAAVTLTGTGFPTVKIGDYYILKGVTGVGASQFNTPIKITGFTLTTSLSFEFLTAPGVALTTAALNTSVKLMKCVWNENAAITADLVGTTGGGVISAYSEVSTGRSNLNQLQKFGLILVLDQVTYAIDNCALDQAVIDFGLDGIASVQWTGKATALRQLGAGAPTISGTTITTGPSITGLVGSFTAKASTTNYITNKLSTAVLKNTIGGSGTPTTYTVPITGGSITIANGINYITPTNLGVVNTPTTYYTGTRAISGSLTAYLRAGTATNGTSDLLDYFLDATTMIEPKFELDLAVGGSGNALKVQVYARGASLQIPTVDAQAVLSTTINFTVQGTDAVLANQTFDLEDPNDLRIRYFAA